MQEVRKSPWGASIKLAVLASRKNLCLNKSVKDLPSQNQLNDACLDRVTGSEAAFKRLATAAAKGKDMAEVRSSQDLSSEINSVEVNQFFT